MKRFDQLYDELASFENLWLAERKAARGKRGQGAVAAFEFDLEDELWRLQEELAGQTYRPGGYTWPAKYRNAPASCRPVRAARGQSVGKI